MNNRDKEDKGDKEEVFTNHNNSQMIGELILIYDENLEFVDENWHI